MQLSDVLSIIPSQAYVASGQLVSRIQDLEQKLNGYDINRTVAEIVTDATFWRSPPRYFAFRNLESELGSISRTISNMVYDLVAVANCAGDESTIPLSMSEAGDIAAEVRRVISREDALLSEIIADLRETSKKLREEFGELSQL